MIDIDSVPPMGMHIDESGNKVLSLSIKDLFTNKRLDLFPKGGDGLSLPANRSKDKRALVVDVCIIYSHQKGLWLATLLL